MPEMRLLPGSVEAALGNVLSSCAFRGCPVLRRLLEYVVAGALRGEAATQQRIAVEVFGRGSTFDPLSDAIVRVHASKLRNRLARYYEREGASEPVVISLPRGTYRPVFRIFEAPSGASLHDEPDALRWQAEHMLTDFTPGRLAAAERYLRGAAVRWPAVPEVHRALAAVTLAGTIMGFEEPESGASRLGRDARRALRTNPERGDVYLYSRLSEIRRRDKAPLVAAVRRALDLSPGDAGVRYWSAQILAADGALAEAVAQMRVAVQLQPGSLFFRTWTAVLLFMAGSPEPAVRHLRDILHVEPQDFLASYWLGQVCAHAGHLDEAEDAARAAYQRAPSGQTLCGIGYVVARAGHTTEADAILARLIQMRRKEYVPASGVAAIHAALGRGRRAAGEFARARQEGDWWLAWRHLDPRWAPLRGKVPGL